MRNIWTGDRARKTWFQTRDSIPLHSSHSFFSPRSHFPSQQPDTKRLTSVDHGGGGTFFFRSSKHIFGARKFYPRKLSVLNLFFCSSVFSVSGFFSRHVATGVPKVISKNWEKRNPQLNLWSHVLLLEFVGREVVCLLYMCAHIPCAECHFRQILAKVCNTCRHWLNNITDVIVSGRFVWLY